MLFKNKHIAITGATGFFGSHITKYFIDNGAKVFCLIRNEMADQKLPDKVNKIYGDLVNKDDVEFFIDRAQPDIFIHLAAQTQAYDAIRNPFFTFNTNINGTLNVLESLRVFNKCKSILIASSDKTYGELVSNEYTENHPLNGLYPYDSSKSITDVLCNSYRATYEMPIVTIRPCNIYGPGDLNYQRIIPAAIKAYVTGEKFTLRNGGKDIREYIHVDDVLSAYVSIIEYGYNNNKYLVDPSFNVSSGDRISTGDMLKLIEKHLGKIDSVIENEKHVEIKNQAMNSNLLKIKTGWEPKKNLNESIKEVIDWYLDKL